MGKPAVGRLKVVPPHAAREQKQKIKRRFISLPRFL
jgi:hypothetical protein